MFASTHVQAKNCIIKQFTRVQLGLKCFATSADSLYGRVNDCLVVLLSFETTNNPANGLVISSSELFDSQVCDLSGLQSWYL